MTKPRTDTSRNPPRRKAEETTGVGIEASILPDAVEAGGLVDSRNIASGPGRDESDDVVVEKVSSSD